jgi:sensor histidine kinase regulating citrate/malate metabolism
LFENHEPTDVNAVLKAVVQLKKGKSRSENISLQLQFCDGLPLVDIDIIYLQLIVLGIIDDAFSALGELDRNDSKRYVKLQTKLHDNRVIIDITNNGNTAINSKNQTRIFNNLFAIKGNKKLGLKLSAFRSTLRQHRGDLELISVKNDIITFRIYLPITEV